MSHRWSGRRGSLLLMAVMLVCAVLTGVAFWRLTVIQRSLPPEVTENAVWGAAAAEIELTRFLDALGQYSTGSGAVDQDRLLERFDLLWSRLDLFRDGELAASVMDASDLKGELEAMRRKLADLDAVVADLAPADAAGAAAVRAALEGYLPALRTVTMHNLNNDHAGRIRLRAMREKEQWTTAIAVLLVIALGLSLVILVRGENVARSFLARIRSTQAEAARARQRLAEAVQCLEQGVALFDEEDRLVLCNAHYRQLYGPVADRVTAGTPFADLLRAGIAAGHFEHQGDADAFILDQVRHRRSAQEHDRDTQQMHGRWFWVEHRGTTDGGLISLHADVTEEKRRELALTAAHDRLERQTAELTALAQKEQRTSAAKSRFLAMISHEIRTPLNGVLGAIQLLADRLAVDDDRRLLSIARNSAEALLVILNDILDFTGTDAGKLTLRPAPFDAADLVRSAIDPYRAPAEAKGIKLEWRIGSDVPARLVGDAGRIRRMLLNYVSNAVKFTTSGTVTLGVERAEGGNGSLRFTVADTGPGIPAGRHGELFADFVQLDLSTTGRPNGAGLGLAITRRLAELMGGRVGLDSAPGLGSTFWFELPLGAAEPGTGKDAASEAPDKLTILNRAPRILVAEDNKTNQLIVRGILQRLGCQVAVVENGAEALAAVQRDAFDLILTDISMPVMDGLEASRRMREMGVTLPIVALTADMTMEEGDTLRRHGIDACLTKPASPPKIRLSLESMLSSA